MYVELRLGGFSHRDIEDMTIDQMQLFYRYVRARFLETISYYVLAHHSKPKRFYNDLMRNIKLLESGKKEIPYYDKEKFREYVRRLEGIIVEEKRGDT